MYDFLRLGWIQVRHAEVWLTLYGEPGTKHLRGRSVPATSRGGSDPSNEMKWGDRYRYLGCPTRAYSTKEQDLNSIREVLVKDTITILKSPLAEWQKLDIFRQFLFPRLTFILQVIFTGSTWCRKLDTTLRGAVKQGIKMPSPPPPPPVGLPTNISICPRPLGVWASPWC